MTYVEALFAHWRRFALLLIALPMVVAGSAALLFPTYHASARIWVESPTYFGGLAPTGWNQYLSPADNEANSLSQLLSTNTFMSQIGDELVADSVISPQSRDATVRALTGKVSAYSDGSNLVSIAASCDQRATCLGAVAATIKLHNEWLSASEQSQAKVATAFYTSQVSQASDRLAADQAALTKYLEQHPGVGADLSSAATIGDPDLANLVQKVQDDQDALQNLEGKLATVQLESAASGEISSTVLKVIDQPRIDKEGLLASLGSKTVMIAAALAAVPGLAYLVIAGWSDRTVRDPREIEHRLGVRVVASIPTVLLAGSTE